MALTVLNDGQIESLLESLTREEYQAFKMTMAQALHDYSNNASTLDDGTYHQPPRSAIQNNETETTTLYIPSSSPLGMGCKVVTLSTPSSSKSPISPVGAITILSPAGTPTGFLHARNLTAFRTALASSCLLGRRASIKTLTCFGTGLQAYWHVRLALLARGATIEHVNFIARGFSPSTKTILKRLHAVPAAMRAREGWPATTFSILTPAFGEYARLLREQVRDADVLFCCAPAREPLFDPEVLTSHEGRRKGRLVVAVGGLTPDTKELPRDLLLRATKRQGAHLHFHKHAPEGGVLVVDSIDGAMREAGDVIEAGLKPNQLVELGELVELHRQSKQNESKEDEHLSKWLREGTVVYKSVGLGVMDLAVGTQLIQMAREKGIGTEVPGF